MFATVDTIIGCATLIAILPVAAFLVANKNAAQRDDYYITTFFLGFFSLVAAILFAMATLDRLPPHPGQAQPKGNQLSQAQAELCSKEIVRWGSKSLSSQRERVMLELLNRCFPNRPPTPNPPVSVDHIQANLCDSLLFQWTKKTKSKQRGQVVLKLMELCLEPDDQASARSLTDRIAAELIELEARIKPE